eukprot:3272382-Amphidinium_carterae.1
MPALWLIPETNIFKGEASQFLYDARLDRAHKLKTTILHLNITFQFEAIRKICKVTTIRKAMQNDAAFEDGKGMMALGTNCQKSSIITS